MEVLLSKMSLTLTLSAGAAAGLNAQAAKLGVSPDALAVQVLEARFTGLSWKATDALALMAYCNARPGVQVDFMPAQLNFSKVSTGSADDMIAGFEELAARGLLVAFDGKSTGFALTQEGYDRLVD